ncbi:mediator of RNA polymerase II transcription subunit 1-domain-containing protein [Paraphoma chrysanthemicola]|uniref:Mediator of RNA polymerase II transcription subunit 1 n=1 Tax=Paraphoma chrysanthemicola TaxID=798071 RepID=A0A8K0RD34_9PLEO|nr:mediator of RNA polymerase II transcription subunit 1-domain-containing protein [Paraphoma chrysanthemicola]
MATPTPSTNTPSKHLPAFSSPAPRSVPHTGNTNMLAYDSPAVLNMLNDASASMGGVGMGISMSGLGMSSLGISASAMGRADEAERSRRLQNILEVVGGKPGRVSEEGLLALCKRLGVQVEKNTAEAHSWMLLIGDEAVCDVTFKNDEISSVNLQTGLDGEQESLQFGPTGSEILVRSLKPLPGQSKINVTLERFAENLDKLLSLDKLGNPQNGGVSCYNAIAGVYTSLRKLFEHEKKMALAVLEANTPQRSHKAEREVLCKKSGRPRLNGGSCLGLSLEYWMDRRHIIHRKPSKENDKGKGKEDGSSQPIGTYPEDDDPETNRLYSLTIECESSPSTLYNPIRISNEWISDKIEKPTDASDANATIDNILLDTPSIDWQDPKPTYLEPAAPTEETMDLNSTPGRLPNIRFVAKFNPPLVVPFAVHMQLYQSVGIEPRPEDFRPTTFVGLALRPGEIDPGMMGAAESTHEIRSSRSVLSIDADGKEKEQKHNMSLYLPKIEYSRTLESLPFSHPKQLVEILPTLRQYAFTTSLLRNAFYEREAKHAQVNASNPLSPPQTPQPSKHDANAVQIDINLSYTPPAPRITFYIPHPSSQTPSPSQQDNSIANLLSNLLSPDSASTSQTSLAITLDIHPNAEIAIQDQNIVPIPAAKEDGDVDMDAAERVDARVKRLGKGLEVVGDVGVWGEWIRGQV